MAKEPNAWIPMTEAIDIKHIGKLQEEVTELMEALFKLDKALSRALIQTMSGVIPHEEKINKQWIEEEIADVKANMELVEKHFNLNIDFIEERKNNKKEFLSKWHTMLNPNTELENLIKELNDKRISFGEIKGDKQFYSMSVTLCAIDTIYLTGTMSKESSLALILEKLEILNKFEDSMTRKPPFSDINELSKKIRRVFELKHKIYLEK